ncbi:hypothetical protein FSLSAGS3026_00838 [Streptococcus agalactiae FSL S3-026]|uniref:hypothetical protein n=1 Tax=Streptococcus agalactiae TaxID=1311 RepID=UPI00021A1686|nr:hypothetical protein FSLSAGS3026_10855 [Streptococcus agalactiae FSL S3-026]EGS28427.1 hypothetical protein FSLSAGS3026_00838 [Streptococcus agalactiae FSL S3-026]
MKTIKEQIEDCIDELENYSSSLSELSKSQYYLLKQTDAKMSDFEDFLDDVNGSVAIFKKE